MAERGGPLAADAEHGHHGARLGTPRLHLRRCDSTNQRAHELALAGAPHGTLVSADEQTAGRGRQGRSWIAPSGSCLLCSLLLRGEHLAPPARLLPLIAGVALCDAIGPQASIKWPNDIVFARPLATTGGANAQAPAALAKVAGVLVEGRPQAGWAVVGVGVNVALSIDQLPDHVRSRAATLARPKSAIEPLLSKLLAALATRLAEPAPQLLGSWRALDALRGREVAWEQGSGLAQGIDEQGLLLVAASGGATVKLEAGEVHLATVS